MSEIHNHYNELAQHLDAQPVQFATIKQQRGGINVIEGFLLLFVGLKLAHIITWSWIWVLAPAWLPALAALGMALFGKALRGVVNKRLRNRW